MDDRDFAEATAYAKAKGFRSAGAMAKVAMTQYMARSELGTRQKAKYDDLLGLTPLPRLAVLREAKGSNVEESHA